MKLRPYQEQCHQAIEEAGPGKWLISLATGLGKCFQKGTKILMFDGSIKNVENIKRNDCLMGFDNKPKTVTKTTTGYEKMYAVSRPKHKDYIVNESHILSLQFTGLKDKKVTDNKGNKYNSHDYINIDIKNYIETTNHFKHVAKGYCQKINFPEKEIIIDPYFLGLWLGDGNSHQLLITTPDVEIIEYLSSFAKDNGYELSKHEDKRSKADGYLLRNFKKKDFIRNYFKENFFYNKHIPFEYSRNSEYNRLQILAGLLDSDGYLHSNDHSTFEFSNKDKKITEEVAFISRSLGLTVTERTKYNKKYDRNYYYCRIFGDTTIIPTKIKRKQSQCNKNKNNLRHGIKLKELGVEKYYGFTLLEEDKRFLLDDFTVVHNTFIFSKLPRTGKTLVLAHREELVLQVKDEFDCPVGFEKAELHSNGEEVISASVQSMINRLDKFHPRYFDRIICDECHNFSAITFSKVLDHFKPIQLLGFTATAFRADGQDLSKHFDKVIFNRDLKWGIENGYSAPLKCKRVNIGYDLSGIKKKAGDYTAKELESKVNIEGANDAIAKIYNESEKPVIIFAVNIAHCESIQEKIPDSVVVTGKTKNRSEIIERVKNGEIDCLINCQVFTEGTNIPNLRTGIIARPTKSIVLYIQMVGRILRWLKDKPYATLVDCVGATRNLDLCTAPCLLGLDLDAVQNPNELIGDLLLDLPKLIKEKSDCFESWIKNIELVKIWKKKRKLNTYNVDYFKFPDGTLLVGLPNNKYLSITPEDSAGNCNIVTNKCTFSAGSLQDNLKLAFKLLKENKFPPAIWNLQRKGGWAKMEASAKQKNYCRGLLSQHGIYADINKANKLQLSSVINYLKYRR